MAGLAGEIKNCQHDCTENVKLYSKILQNLLGLCEGKEYGRYTR